MNIEDLALVKSAAKAIGAASYDCFSRPNSGIDIGPPGLLPTIYYPDETQGVWNPLQDDAECFRLAMMLNLSVIYDQSEIRVHRIQFREGKATTHNNYSRIVSGDVVAAARRAIVTVAAQIGDAL